MKEKNIVRDKSYQFALDIVNTIGNLQRESREYVLTRQCIRSGTSIGANIEEASAGQSRKDFIAKMSIASKEARETHYWLRLLRDSSYLREEKALGLVEDCVVLIKLLTAIVKTSQQSLQIKH